MAERSPSQVVSERARPRDASAPVAPGRRAGGACCVCGARDARSLAGVELSGGARATLCGSHALILQRAGTAARSEADLRRLVGERRGRRDRRQEGDELGEALTAAFSQRRRAGDGSPQL